MRVKVWVETEAEVDLPVQDMIDALGHLPDSEIEGAIASAINTAYSVLKRVPDKYIAEMNESRRQIIGKALLEQSRRYIGAMKKDDHA